MSLSHTRLYCHFCTFKKLLRNLWLCGRGASQVRRPREEPLSVLQVHLVGSRVFHTALRYPDLQRSGGGVFLHTCRDELGSPVCAPLRLMPGPLSRAGGHPVSAQLWGSTSLQPYAVVHFDLFLPFIFSQLWLPSFRARLATVVCCPSWDSSQGDLTASHSRLSAPGLTAVPSVCHRWNPGSSWGSRVLPQPWHPSADRASSSCL